MALDFLSVFLLILVCSAVRSQESPYGRTGSTFHPALGQDKSLVRTQLRIPRVEAAGLVAFKNQPVPFEDPSDDEVTSNTIPIYSSPGISPSVKYINLLIGPQDAVGFTAVENFEGSAHLSTIKFGNQSFVVTLDTGSADTWVTGSGFVCKSPNPCRFGTGYVQTKSFVPEPNLKLNIQYDSGEQLEGSMGRETVTLGNITVQNQTVGIIHSGSWQGDGKSSGLIGMAFPGDTRAYAATNSSKDDSGFPVPYNSLFTTMYQQGLIKPYFSLALSRTNETNGVLALGGLPGPPIRYSEPFTRSKFQYLTFADGSPMHSPIQYNLYMIRTDGFHVDSQNTKKAVDAIIDSGSPFIYLPREISQNVNKGWKPPATQDRTTSQWIVNCNAVPPDFAVIVNNTKLRVDGESMVIKGGVGVVPPLKDTRKCLSGVQQSGMLNFGVHILGTPFLESVVAVFDVGAVEMRFAQRIR